MEKEKPDEGKPNDAIDLEQLRQATGADKVEALDQEGKVLETAEKPPEETELARAQRLVQEKKQAEKPVIEMTEEDFQARVAQAQAMQGQRSQQQNQQIQARLGRLLDGKEKPKNEVVEYFLERLRDGRNEAQMAQLNIQETSTRLKQLQARLLQLQGEQNKRVEDIVAWWDRDMKTDAGDPPPDDEGEDLVKGE